MWRLTLLSRKIGRQWSRHHMRLTVWRGVKVDEQCKFFLLDSWKTANGDLKFYLGVLPTFILGERERGRGRGRGCCHLICSLVAIFYPYLYETTHSGWLESREMPSCFEVSQRGFSSFLKIMFGCVVLVNWLTATFHDISIEFPNHLCI